MNTYEVVTQKNIVAKWIGYLVLIDLLIFPYFQFVIIPYSFPLILLGFILLNARISNDYYFRLYIIIICAVLISLAISLILPPYSKYASYNIKSAFQFITSFIYFFYFRWLIQKTQLNIIPFLVIFVIWYAFLGFLFATTPQEANELITSIYGRLVIKEADALDDLRFAYLFSDANTSIYFFLLALTPLLLYVKDITLLLSLLTIGALMVLLSQSSGGFTAYCLIVFVLFWSGRVKSLLFRKKLYSILVVLAFSGLWIYFINLLQDNLLAEYAITRLFGENERYLSGGGRFKHWSALYENLVPLPIGRGYNLIDNGDIKPPHSDFLGILYRYGFVTLFSSILFFFSKFRNVTLLLIPAAMAFAINSLLDEHKLLNLFLSLLAISITINPSQSKENQT